MAMEDEIIYQMDSPDDLLLTGTENVRWLEYPDDYDLFYRHLLACGQISFAESFTEEKWRSHCEDGITYCGLILGGEIVARAAVERYSDSTWETADVRVVKSERNKGYAKQVVCYVTKYILQSGRLATCRTLESNLAMKKVIQSVGFNMSH